jgi:NhaP-type Na+/H+ or K+/H+ antiporter
MSTRQIPAAIGEFETVSIGSIVIGVCIGLLCSFLFKHSHIGKYPTYEIGLLFLFAYGSYAMAEVSQSVGCVCCRQCEVLDRGGGGEGWVEMG